MNSKLDDFESEKEILKNKLKQRVLKLKKSSTIGKIGELEVMKTLKIYQWTIYSWDSDSPSDLVWVYKWKNYNFQVKTRVDCFKNNWYEFFIRKQNRKWENISYTHNEVTHFICVDLKSESMFIIPIEECEWQKSITFKIDNIKENSRDWKDYLLINFLEELSEENQ